MDLLLVNEAIKVVGKLFLNPLLYIFIMLVIISGYERRKKEGVDLGHKKLLLPVEIKNTLSISLFGSLIISIFTLGIGIPFTYQFMFVLIFVTFVLSTAFQFSMFSASYTFGFTYLLIIILSENMTDYSLTYILIALLMGILLFFEAGILLMVKKGDSYRELVYSKRGKWYQQNHLKKISLIPFLALIPNGTITSTSLFWPYFSIGEESYSIILFPVFIGFHYIVKGVEPEKVAKKLGKNIAILSLLVLVFAGGSFLFPLLSFVAVMIGIIGRSYIHYRYIKLEKKHPLTFIQE